MSYSFSKGSCNLKRPISIGRELIDKREWIQVTKNNITVDLAPLPGLHLETLEESFNDFKSNSFTTPSALFAKEVFELFTAVQDVEVNSNKLLFIDIGSDPKSSAAILSPGVYKLKIGRADLILEKKWLSSFLENLPSDVSLRLDGNRSFSVETLDQYLDLLDLKNIQYIEEPLKEVEQWPRLSRASEVKLALDENIGRRREMEFASFLVAKPTWNISLKNTLRELALENQEVIISSAFEPPNNIKLLNMIASESDQACGLDTLKFFDLESLKVFPL